MPLHHYLPATYLARFSNDNNPDRRKRIIYTGKKSTRNIFKTSVSNAGAINNLYTLNDARQDMNLVDNIWEKYEQDLNKAIEKMIDQSIDAITWARIMVPFVTCMLVRTPDFDDRFKKRMIELFGDEDRTTEDNIKSARIFEIQRLLGPIAAADWIVFSVGDNQELITNDLGYAVFTNMPTIEIGISIPLGKKHMLGVIPKTMRIIAQEINGIWLPVIQYGDLHTNTEDINNSLASISREYFFGSNDELITKFINIEPNLRGGPEPSDIGFLSGPSALIHEFVWHKLIGVLECDPNSLDAWNFEFKWNKIKNGWHPHIILPTNLPVFPVGLYRRKNQIIIDLYEIESMSYYHQFLLYAKYLH